MTLGPGVGLLVINNLDALHAAKQAAGDVSVLVSLSSTCSCLGRAASGFASDAALRRAGVPRPHALAAASALMGASMLVLLLDGSVPLYVAVAGAGAAFGSLNAVFPACVAEIFGHRNVPLLYTVLAMGLALGSALFATGLYAAVDAAAQRRHNHPDPPDDAAAGARSGWRGMMAMAMMPDEQDEDEYDDDGAHRRCVGTDCFALSAVVSAAACGVGAGLAMLLGGITRGRYRELDLVRERTALGQ